jgi:hypothetical protein
MAKANSTRRRAGSSHSPKPGSPSEADRQFDDLQHRFLGLLSRFQLAARDFGDFTRLPKEHVPAAHVASEAANELDELYDQIDEWYVHHEHRPKAIESAEPSVEASEDDGAEGQRLYDGVADLERQLKGLMDGIPYSILDEDQETCDWLGDAAVHLRRAVAVLQKVHDKEAARYNRSAAANTVKGTEAQPGAPKTAAL